MSKDPEIQNKNEFPYQIKEELSNAKNNDLDGDLKKAVTFLLSKEMKEYSLDKKREFLLKKLPSNVVDKAIELYPIFENNVNAQIQEYKTKGQTDSEKSFFSSFFDFGMLSSVILTTLGLNYLLDLNRNKKNDLFYKDTEKKINEEINKITDEMKSKISAELSEYVKSEGLNDKINSQILINNQQKGLTLNLSSKNLKEEVLNLQKKLETSEVKIRELNNKIENNSLMLKQEMIKEIKNIVEDNNTKLLMK